MKTPLSPVAPTERRPPHGERNRPQFWLASAVFFLAIAVRLLFLGALAGSPFFEPIPGGNDRALYDSLAQRVARGTLFPAGVFEFMPLYPWALGALYSLAGPNLYAAGFVGALLDALTAALATAFALRVGAARWAAAATGALYALYPTAIAYSAVTMPNTLNAFLLLAFVVAATRLGESMWHGRPRLCSNPSATAEGGCVTPVTSSGSSGGLSRGDPAAVGAMAWWGLGLLGGVAALGFAGMLLVALVIAAWLAVGDARRNGGSSAALRVGLLAFGFALPIAPVTLHNWRAEGRFVLVTAHGGFNLFMGNHAGATGYPVQIGGFRGEAGSLLADARAEAEKARGHPLASAEVSAFWAARARAWWREHPGDALGLFARKAVKLFNRAEYDDLRLVPMVRLGGVAFDSPLWPSFAGLAWLGLAGLLAARAPAPLKAALLASAAGVVLFFVTSRYRLTLAPLFAALGALALSQFAAAWAGGDRRRAAGLGAAFLVAAAPVAWPLHGTDFRALDHYNTAAFLLQKGHVVGAQGQALRGLALEPGRADLHFVLGNTFFAEGRHGMARAAFENAVKLKPSRAAYRFNLAMVCQRLGDAAAAKREAAEALRLDPAHDRARALLAELRAATASPPKKSGQR